MYSSLFLLDYGDVLMILFDQYVWKTSNLVAFFGKYGLLSANKHSKLI